MYEFVMFFEIIYKYQILTLVLKCRKNKYIKKCLLYKKNFIQLAHEF